MDFREIIAGEWIQLAQARTGGVLVNVVMTLRVLAPQS
jgi:hypothetical protein